MMQIKCRHFAKVCLCALALSMMVLACHKMNPSRPPLRSNFPVIDSISPKTGPVGTVVTIYGKNLGDNNSEIFVNGRKGGNKTPSETKFVITVPDTAGTGPITITTKYGKATGPVFSYIFTDTWVVSTFAGSGQAGSVDGPGALASFNDPRGITKDASGNLFVADAFNNKIRKITIAGTVVTVSTLAGSGVPGNANGTGAAAQFNFPLGITIDPLNNLYVVDSKNNKIRKVTSAGVVTNWAGSGNSGSTDNTTGLLATFNEPIGITIDPQNNLYVADAPNNKIRIINSVAGVNTFAGSGMSGTANGTGIAAQFQSPEGIVLDPQGSFLYVADFLGNRIRRISVPGAVVSSPIGSGIVGSGDGVGTAASFHGPHGITIDPLSGNLYVADWHNNRIRKVTISNSEVKNFAGGTSTVFADGDALSKATFNHPGFIVTDTQGNLYVTDGTNNRIRKITLVKH